MTPQTLPGRRLRSKRKPTSFNATLGSVVTYKAWIAMLARSRGRRGGPVDARWNESFDAFYEDAGPAPEGHTIRPVEPRKPIGPDNFHWVPSKQVGCSGRPCKQVYIDGRLRRIDELAAEHGISTALLRQRFSRGLPLERAISPVDLRRAA